MHFMRAMPPSRTNTTAPTMRRTERIASHHLDHGFGGHSMPSSSQGIARAKWRPAPSQDSGSTVAVSVRCIANGADFVNRTGGA